MPFVSVYHEVRFALADRFQRISEPVIYMLLWVKRLSVCISYSIWYKRVFSPRFLVMNLPKAKHAFIQFQLGI